MTLRVRRLLPADLRGQVAGILFVGLALSQLVAAVLYVVLLPKWQGMLRPDAAVSRIEMVVRLLESVEPAQRPALARLWSEDGFRVSYDATESVGNRRVVDSRYDQLRDQIAAKLHKSPSDLSAHSTEGPRMRPGCASRCAVAGRSK